MDAVGGLAGVLGVLGFALAVVNWYRLRPDLFVSGPNLIYEAKQGVLRPSSAIVEVHNAGAAGVTLAVIEIRPGTTGVDTVSAFHHARLFEAKEWLVGPSFPCRLEGSDTKVWTIDVRKLRDSYDEPTPTEFTVTGSWFGRKRFWPWALVHEPGRRLPGVGRMPEDMRRERRIQVILSVESHAM